MYDLAILGAGPGGYVAAERAGAKGLSTVLFEKNELGGVCLNEGCIPTKTLLYSAKMLDHARHGEPYGVRVEQAEPDFAAIMKRKVKVVRKLVAGVRAGVKAAGVEIVKGEAVILGREGEAFRIACEGQEYQAARLLVCTGSEAVLPPIPGLREAGEWVVTSREILALEEAPQELVVIGGGVIGMEFASFFHSIGTRVTVVEMLPKILGPMDGELSEMLLRQYAKRGVSFCLGCRVTAIEDDTVVYEDPQGQVCRVRGDKILVSVGRWARLQGYGLETLAPEPAVNAAGRPVGIRVDEYMRTSVPGLYAAGDVTGFSMLAHTASREGEIAVDHMTGGTEPMRYDAIPGVVYTNPEVAGVGLTEEEAQQRGIAYSLLKLPMAYSGRFVAENERGEGLCKILLEPRKQTVLGVHLLGNPASELIHSACLAISGGMTAGQFRRTVFPHPTVSEILRETALTSGR